MSGPDRSSRIRGWIDALNELRTELQGKSRERFDAQLDDMREAWRDELGVELRRDTDRNWELCKHDRLRRHCEECKP
jgi:hypothetical protein